MKDAYRSFEFLPLAVLGVVFVALFPWLRSHVSFPEEPFDVTVIYRDRAGDIQYFPLIAQLARGTITDGTIRETEGSVWRSFPHATLIPHAACVAAFGKYGFPVADAIIAIGYFTSLVLFFRTLGISRPSSTIVALFLTLQVPISLQVAARLGPLRPSFPLITQLWGMRIPRPFISELYVVIALVAAMRLVASEHPRRLVHWLLLAGSFGLLVQGDLHAALIFALASPVLIYCVARREGFVPTLRSCLYAGIFFFAVISLFLCQRIHESPDIPIRWGMFEVPRLAGFTRSWREIFKPALAAALVGLVVAQRRRPQDAEPHGEQQEAIRRVWPFSIALLFAAFACKAVSIAILGKTIQPYHFDERARTLCSYLVIGFAVFWIDGLLQRLSAQSRFFAWDKPAFRACCHGAILALLVSYLGYNVLNPRRTAEYRSHLRASYYDYTAAIRPSYRECFTELTRFLEAKIPHNSVVASFDHQVFSWWLTFHRGYWFLVEPFVSSLPDNELETRLALLCKLLGMPSHDYGEFIQIPSINLFWLGLAKYQASQWHTYLPLYDYTDQQRKAIAQTDSVWQIIIPRSEVARLKSQYEKLSLVELERRDLDVVVLSKGGPDERLAPPAGDWHLVFENNGFRVYRKAK